MRCKNINLKPINPSNEGGDGGDEQDPNSKTGDQDGDNQGQGNSQDDGDGDESEGDQDGEGNSPSDQNGEGQDGEGQDGQGDQNGQDGGNQEGQDGSQGGNQGGQKGQGGGQDDGKFDPLNPSKGAGGMGDPNSKTLSQLWDQFEEALSNGGTDILDGNSAMKQAVEETVKELVNECKSGEKPFLLGDTTHDKILWADNDDHSRKVAQVLLNQVRNRTNYLRTALRQMVRAMEYTHITHGVKRGKGLSARTLVDTALSVRSGKMPNRAYFDPDGKIDTSIACAICLDESGSMGSSLGEATKMLLALTEPIEQIGGKVLAYGFREGWDSVDNSHTFHRDNDNLLYDIFKAWEEKLVSVKGRFANTRASGGTPMADGVAFGIDNLKLRPEKHRILFVLTDGEPNYGHKPVLKYLIRKAKEEHGIHVVGVGWGSGGTGVKNIYPDHAWARNDEEIPRLLVSKLRVLLKEKLKR